MKPTETMSELTQKRYELKNDLIRVLIHPRYESLSGEQKGCLLLELEGECDPLGMG